ncbi:MAG: PEP-CTERM sorting domain-containing protein [Pirellulales bacterium]|nr:PEP-CTERM sorting domain-containing protein [Pirellulales bacterium]
MKIVATGDSLTGQYWSYLPQAFSGEGVSAVVPDPVYSHPATICTARGGLAAPYYVGRMAYSPEAPINYAANVLAADPDVVLFMLGINDLGWDNKVDARFDAYKNDIGSVFESFANFTNSRGERPKVVVGSVLPFDIAKNNAYWSMARPFDPMDWLDNKWNAWLEREADRYGFTYVDNFSAIQQVPDWKTSLMAAHDGLHLSERGSQWVASQFAAAAAVPEPSTLALLVLGAIGLLAYGGLRRGRA